MTTFLSAYPAIRLSAQCPDGTPPPCQRAVRPVRLDRNLVAIFPFRLTGSALSSGWLREGAADLLNLALDDMGTWRVVSPRALLARARDFTDATSEAEAASVARSLGAGRMILGTAIVAGREFRARAELFDAVMSQKLASVGGAGLLDDPAPVIDSLAVALVRAVLVAGSSAHPRPLTEFATASPAALRSYLESERLARRGEWISAADSLLGAIARDSTFGLAYYRLWVAGTFGAGGQLTFDPAARALRYASRLTPRQLMLLETVRAMNEGDARRALSMAGELGRLYVDDPEAAFQQGEVLYHLGLALGESSPRATLDAFDRAIQLDSTLVDPYNHAVELRVMLGDTAAGRVLAERAVARAPHSWIHRTTALAARLASGDHPASVIRRAEFLRDSLRSDLIFWHTAWEVSRMLTEEPARALALADTLLAHGAAPRWSSDMRLSHLGRRVVLRATQGRFREARELLDVIRQLAPESPSPLFAPMVAVTSGDSCTGDWVGLLQGEDTTRSPLDLALLGMHALASRDSVRLARLLGRLRESSESEAPYRHAIAAGLDGLDWLERGDTTRARQLLLLAQTAPPYPYQGPSRAYDLSPLFAARLAQLELAAGLPVEARRRLESATFVLGLVPWRAQLEELRGHVGDALGDSTLAIRGYRNFIALWEHADSGLQPRVIAARLALARLER